MVAEAGRFAAVRAPGGEVASVVHLADQLSGELPQLLVPGMSSATTIGDAGWTSGATAVVAQLPNVADPALSTEETLKRISLSLRVGDLAAVLAPANVLVAPLRDESLLLRADVLRTGTVWAVVHLPAGLWTTRPRQRLALWVLGDAHSDIPRERQWITVADLVSDILTALCDARSVRGHAFRLARTVVASSVLATDGALVRPRPRPVRRAREPAADTALRVLPGARMRREDIGEGAPVIGPTEVLAGHHSACGIDRLVLAASYPSVRYLDPGDVLICGSPQLRSYVDFHGFGAAEAPVRILRIIDSDTATPRPEVIAAAVNGAPDGTPWRMVTVPLLPVADLAALACTLAQVEVARAAAADRLNALVELRSALMAAVPTGALKLMVDASCADDLNQKAG